MRVLVTGSEGYIGSVLTPMLVQRGYDVTGVDSGYFGDCQLVAPAENYTYLRRDIRDLTAAELEGFHAIIHLAALSNDPLGNLDSSWTKGINLNASVSLARHAWAAGVARFLFSSSCIMYGLAEEAVVDEESPLNPQTAYARSKVEAERAIAGLTTADFAPTFLRNGTVYGVSPRMRFDTVLNNLMGSALTSGKVVLFSNGKPWRPVIHVEDVARAFIAILQAPIDVVRGQALNVGADHLNWQIGALADLVASSVPGCSVEYRNEPGADQRTYKTSFAKIARLLPQFRVELTVPEGVKRLRDDLTAVPLTRPDFTDARYTRVRWLQRLLDAHDLDGSLRWFSTSAVAV